MNSGLYVIYSSLLTVFILSSCILYMLVVSEIVEATNATTPDFKATVENNISENVDAKESPNFKENLQKPEENNIGRKEENIPQPELIFSESLSQNSAITEGQFKTIQPKLSVSLPNPLSDKEETKTENSSTTNESSAKSEVEVEPSVEPETEKIPPPVVKAIPIDSVDKNEDLFGKPDNAEEILESNSVISEFTNDTESLGSTENEEGKPQEDIPSFSEWAKKQLAEAEKQDTVNNHSSQTGQPSSNGNGKIVKVRTKNYASPACGAKVIAYNLEAGSANSILSQNKDEYMLNTCNSKIWFVVELCEPIQAEKIELANFELFSSSPKDFAVYLSNRFPTREWTSVGKFTAKDERSIQTFPLYPHLFGKFIKVEMLSHYGSEHYCPISMFKAFGTSEFEVLEKENTQQTADDDDDEILGDLPDSVSSEIEHTKNLFGSARDAVISIVKKAAEALVKSDVSKTSTQTNKTNILNDINDCCSPSHIVVCDNCSNTVFENVFQLISCQTKSLLSLIKNKFISNTLRHSDLCNNYGLNLGNEESHSYSKRKPELIHSIFSEKYIAALCNLLAINEGKIVLNSSISTNETTSVNQTLDKLSKTTLTEKEIAHIVEMPNENENSNDDFKENLVITDDQYSPNLEESQTEETSFSGDDAVTENEFKEKEPKQNNEIDSLDTSQSNETEVPIESVESEKQAELNTHTINEEDTKGTNDLTAVNTNVSETQNSPLENESFVDLELMSDSSNQQGPASSGNNQNQQGQSPQSESVFMRLSNRVKALERNMSLSGQYLEELSRRYKKQVEEMQKSFDKTITQINEDKRKYDEREKAYGEQIDSLKSDIILLTAAVNSLVEQQTSWFGNITLIKFVILQLIILAVYIFIKSRHKPIQPVPVVTITAKKGSKNKKNLGKLRRKSVEGVSGHSTPSYKPRRPSEEALRIARLSAEEAETNNEEWKFVSPKNRRRKTSILNKTHPFVEAYNKEWQRQDSIGVLQENVIPLDEQEFIAPVSEPKQFNDDDTVVQLSRKENGKVNQSSSKSAMKVSKKRRLSSPAFLKSALSRQTSRSGSNSQNNNSTIETDTAGSESSSVKSVSNTFIIKSNGKVVSPLSKKRSIKSIFKKVF